MTTGTGRSPLSCLWAILLVYLNNTQIKLVHSNFSDLSGSSFISSHTFIYGIYASSLDRTLNSIPYRQQKLFRRCCYFLPGLSFNNNAKNSLKDLQNFLNRGILSRSRDSIIWHNLINNSISAHRSNNNQPFTTSQLIEIFSQWQTRIKAIVYCQRSGTVNILIKLFGTGIVIIDAKTKMISHRKQKDVFILSELKRFHPKVDLEYKLLSTAWRNRSCLSKSKPKKKNMKKPSKKKRKKVKQRKQS